MIAPPGADPADYTPAGPRQQQQGHQRRGRGNARRDRGMRRAGGGGSGRMDVD